MAIATLLHLNPNFISSSWHLLEGHLFSTLNYLVLSNSFNSLDLRLILSNLPCHYGPFLLNQCLTITLTFVENFFFESVIFIP